MAAEQADRRNIGDRDDIVGQAEERILFLIDPTREIGVAKARKGRSFVDRRCDRVRRAGKRQALVHGAGRAAAGSSLQALVTGGGREIETVVEEQMVASRATND